MKVEELKQWQAELLGERQKELDAVDTKYKRKLAAIEVLLEDQDDAAETTRKPVLLGDHYRKSMNKLAVTREGITQSSQRFTTASVFAYVTSKYPGMVKVPADLSNSVWILKKTGEIEVIKKGAGPDSPAEYRITAKFRPASGNGV